MVSQNKTVEVNMKTLIDYYDDYAEAWAEKWYADSTLLPYLTEFVKLLPSNATVLDLCCGAGYESMRMNNLGVNVVGVDLSKKSIELAKTHNKTIEFFVKDMLVPYKDLGQFDGIACIAGLVHLPENKLEIAFKNMYEVLKDNSYMFIVVKDGKKIINSIEVDGKEYAREFYCYTLDVLLKHSDKYFEFEKSMETAQDDAWKYYIFKKK
jgi:SAM-dependent methyltransferase